MSELMCLPKREQERSNQTTESATARRRASSRHSQCLRISYSEKKSIIKALSVSQNQLQREEEHHQDTLGVSESATARRRASSRHSQCPRTRGDGYNLLSRQQQVALVSLRTGYNRLSDHLYRTLKLLPFPACLCGQEDHGGT